MRCSSRKLTMKANNNYLLGGVPIKNKDFTLGSFIEALRFVRKNDSFKTVDLQRALKIGYGKDLKRPVYIIEKVLARNGFEVVDKEVIEKTSKDN